jgi:BirA family biotin operon repressor/biotin-[acetyl-CoA-carboxylase] ligase
MGRPWRDARAGYVCLAERQTAGRGRRGGNWVSPFGSNVYLSVSWGFNTGTAALSGLSLVVGVAVARVLRASAAADIGLKWPNDILWAGRKLAGILIEMSGEATGPCTAVVGIGINVRMPAHQGATIGQPWVDLTEVMAGEPLGRNELVAQLLNSVLPTLESFEKKGLEPFLDEWHRLDVFHGKNVVLKQPAGEVAGRVMGVDARGCLLLDHDGVQRSYGSGEVSLRASG